MTPLIISADDFAQSTAIDAGIIDLIQKGRITATSCLTMSPRWPDSAKALTPEIRKIADIGLHLDFTQFSRPLKHKLPTLMLMAACRGLSEKAIRTTIVRQLDAFEDAMGSAPDYIDGHQHVHQLPQIRETLIKEVSARYQTNKPWFRISKPMPPLSFKARIIDFCGADELKKLCLKNNIRHTETLAGIYDFSPSAPDYLQLLVGWANTISRTSGVVALMCHPAIAETSQDLQSDPIYLHRTREYSAFNDERFATLLQANKIRLVRGNEAFEEVRRKQG